MLEKVMYKRLYTFLSNNNNMINKLHHSHKKRKDSMEGSLVRVLLAAELEFPKILVPMLPQDTSNVSIECARKSKQLYYLCDQLLGALIYLDVFVLMLICFKLIMPYVSYAVIGCCSLRTTLGKTLLQLLLKIV